MSEEARAVIIDDYAGVGGVRIGRVAVADPGLGEVCVKVAAAAIGPWDRFTTEGAFAELLGDASHAAFPMVLGWDLVGTIVAAGEGSDLAPETRVLAMTRQPLTGVGAQSERVTLPAEACAAVPTASQIRTWRACRAAGWPLGRPSTRWASTPSASGSSSSARPASSGVWSRGSPSAAAGG